MAIDADFAGIGLVGAGNHLDEGRLAGSVVANQRHDLAMQQGEVGVEKRLHMPELLRYAAELEDRARRSRRRRG